MVTVTGDLMNSSLVGGEGHVPVIAHLHFPHPPPAARWCKEAIFPLGRQSWVAAQTGGQQGISSGLE